MRPLRGFTLVEAIFYIAITALMFTLAADMIASAVTAFGKAKTLRNMSEQGSSIMERIIREIRLAHAIDTINSTFDVNPGILSLNTIISPANETETIRKFFVQDGNLMMQEGISPALSLSSNATIANFVLRHIKISASAYYVRGGWGGCSDSATGISPDSAFCTTSKAASLAGPGTVVFVGSSTYAESVTPAENGGSGNLITFFADTDGTYTGDAGPVIVEGGLFPAFNLSERSFIRVIGFTIQNSTNGIYFDNDATSDSLNIIIEHNTFTNISGLAAINNDDGTSQVKNANHIIRRNLIYNNTARAMMFDRAGNILVEDNVVYSNGTDNIAILGSTGTIRNNLIYKSGGREGIDLRGVSGWPMNLVIANNTLYKNRAGIQITSIKAGDTYLIQDNLIKDNSGGSQQGGVYIENTGGINCAISYNIFHGNAPDIDDAGNQCSKNNNLFNNPLLVDPDGADNTLGGANGGDDRFHLSHIASGQGSNSPAMDAGSQSSSTAGLDAWTTRTDTIGDAGIVDMGYHYPATPYSDPTFTVGSGSSLSQAIRVELTIEGGIGRQHISQRFYGTGVLRRNY